MIEVTVRCQHGGPGCHGTARVDPVAGEVMPTRDVDTGALTVDMGWADLPEGWTFDGGRDLCPHCAAEHPPRTNWYGPGYYQHYKGGIYEAAGLGVCEETIGDPEPKVKVVYRPIARYKDVREPFVLRDLDVWNECVEHEGKTVPRFLFLDTARGRRATDGAWSATGRA